jgi:hypothetical protein
VIRDINIYGVYLPGTMVAATAALLLHRAVRRLLLAAGLYKLVWHPALFDTAIFVSIFSLISLNLGSLVG